MFANSGAFAKAVGDAVRSCYPGFRALNIEPRWENNGNFDHGNIWTPMSSLGRSMVKSIHTNFGPFILWFAASPEDGITQKANRTWNAAMKNRMTSQPILNTHFGFDDVFRCQFSFGPEHVDIKKWPNMTRFFTLRGGQVRPNLRGSNGLFQSEFSWVEKKNMAQIGLISSNPFWITVFALPFGTRLLPH